MRCTLLVGWRITSFSWSTAGEIGIRVQHIFSHRTKNPICIFFPLLAIRSSPRLFYFLFWLVETPAAAVQKQKPQPLFRRACGSRPVPYSPSKSLTHKAKLYAQPVGLVPRPSSGWLGVPLAGGSQRAMPVGNLSATRKGRINASHAARWNSLPRRKTAERLAHQLKE